MVSATSRWCQYFDTPFYVFFSPLTSARPLHFPLPSNHPPRYPRAEARRGNTALSAQLLKPQIIRDCKEHPVPMHKHTNVTRLANSPACSYTRSGENKTVTNAHYLQVSLPIQYQDGPPPPPPHFRASPADKPHTPFQHSPLQLSRDLFLRSFFFKDGKTLWVELPALGVFWSAKHFTWAMNHQQWQQKKHLVISNEETSN